MSEGLRDSLRRAEQRELVALAEVDELRARVAELEAKLDKAVDLLRGWNRCPEVTECAPEDRDPDTESTWRDTREFLEETAP